MNTTIKHEGVISQIEGQKITVRIVQAMACGTCNVAGHCHASGGKEKTVDVYDANAVNYHVGEVVTVIADGSVGHLAVAWGFGIPLIIMLATMFLIKAFTGQDAFAALLSIATLIPYYLILYLFRNKIQRKLVFRIEK